ncbi:AraC family transcriptional regulator [Saliterribacillus persicus]|uniref:AraC-like DNA-binding protein n=1 Tax=Saliterribacillus persicus TaxID=930114 RepID=A0A368Y635_9BACI|nr:AraC family transcriptional regulator [Saliterribacillus persicus]RCW74798.1 AraC-like DNA-binding protein [Saliterribacillus persicus]
MKKELDLTHIGIRLYESKHQAGDEVLEHYHGFYQLLYVLEGDGKIILNGKSDSFSLDHVAMITPNCSHAILSDNRLTILVLAFDDERIDPMYKKDLLDKQFKNTKLLELSPFDSSAVRHILRTMLYETSNEGPMKEAAIRIYLSELLLKLARSEDQTDSVDANSLRAERLKKFIDSHYFEFMRAEDLAQKLQMSTRHMNNIFKENYHLTPMQYLTHVRVELAKKLLTESDKDIASICFEVGFESVSTFYRSFKQATSISPHKFRTGQKQIKE